MSFSVYVLVHTDLQVMAEPTYTFDLTLIESSKPQGS